jgi:uncharacterized protein (DUF924 family)
MQAAFRARPFSLPHCFFTSSPHTFATAVALDSLALQAAERSLLLMCSLTQALMRPYPGSTEPQTFLISAAQGKRVCATALDASMNDRAAPVAKIFNILVFSYSEVSHLSRNISGRLLFIRPCARP